MVPDGTAASDPQKRPDPAAQAHQFSALIRTHFGVVIGTETLALIRWYLWQVGQTNTDDLLAAIFLECWEAKRKGIEITDGEVRRAADRVRQRVVRESRRSVTTTAIDQTSTNLPPDDEAELVIREFRALLHNRSPEDALLFQRYYLDNNRDVASLAIEFGMSVPTIYRRLAAIRTDYLALRDLRQPPHAAD